jgi:hypothetical protein
MGHGIPGPAQSSCGQPSCGCASQIQPSLQKQTCAGFGRRLMVGPRSCTTAPTAARARNCVRPRNLLRSLTDAEARARQVRSRTGATRLDSRKESAGYGSRAYSARASLRTGTSGSALPERQEIVVSALRLLEVIDPQNVLLQSRTGAMSLVRIPFEPLE